MAETQVLMNDFPPQGTFLTNRHRRVLGNLSQPRSHRDILRHMRALDTRHSPWVSRGVKKPKKDPDAEDEYFTPEEVLDQILKDLDKHGLAINLGKFKQEPENVGKAIADAMEAHKDVPDMHPEQRELFCLRVGHPGKLPFPADEGDIWVLSKLGLDKLNAPAPDPDDPTEPDLRELEGAALAGALEFNRDLERRQEELIESEARRQAGPHEKRLRDLKKRIKGDDK
jgi:hypothetical protein